jgi:hypothetical protein
VAVYTDHMGKTSQTTDRHVERIESLAESHENRTLVRAIGQPTVARPPAMVEYIDSYTGSRESNSPQDIEAVNDVKNQLESIRSL